MNTGVGSLSLLRGILLTQEANQGFQHCRWILYQLSYHIAKDWWEKAGGGRDKWWIIVDMAWRQRVEKLLCCKLIVSWPLPNALSGAYWVGRKLINIYSWLDQIVYLLKVSPSFGLVVIKLTLSQTSALRDMARDSAWLYSSIHWIKRSWRHGVSFDLKAN